MPAIRMMAAPAHARKKCEIYAIMFYRLDCQLVTPLNLVKNLEENGKDIGHKVPF